MSVRVQTLLLVVACALGGMALSTALALRFRDVQRRMEELAAASAAVRDAERLLPVAGEWRTLTSHLLRQSDPKLLESTARLAAALLRQVRDLHGTSLAARHAEALRQLEHRLLQIPALGARMPDNGTARSDAEIAATEVALDEALRLAGLVHAGLLEDAKHGTEELKTRRDALQALGVFGSVAYALLVGLVWSLGLRRVIRPLSTLTTAAERAAADEAPFLCPERGPVEVRRLTRAIATLTNGLQAAREHVDDEVRRRTADLAAASSTKSDFLATMTHELRTPLNGVIGLTELLLRTELQAEQREFAQMAHNAAESLLALINAVLDFSKIEAGKLQLETTAFNPRDIVEETDQILASVAQEKGIDLFAVIDHRVPERLLGDPLRLRQVLLNLANNALKFTERGHVVIRLSESTHDDTGSELTFEVVDTGIGIAADRLPSLFASFTQAETSTTRRFGGTGLGLAISKHLVELMGGQIGVRSEPGAGSTFWFTVRLRAQSRPVSLQPPPWPKELRIALGVQRPLVREMMREHLLFLRVAPERILQQLEGAAPGPAIAILDSRDATDLDTAIAALRRGHAADLPVCVLQPLAQPLEPAGERVFHLREPVTADQVRGMLLRALGLATWSGARPAAVAPQPGRLRGRRVLLAEDNVVNQRVALAMLQQAGITCDVVADGEQVVERLRQRAYDVVLMDCQMPVQDGFAATRSIRTLEAAGRLAAGNPSPLPIIALTANALPGERERCLEAGMSGYLSKPIKTTPLLRALDEHVHARAAEAT